MRSTIFNHEKALRALVIEVLEALGGGGERPDERAVCHMLDQLGFEMKHALESVEEAQNEDERGTAIIALQGVQRRLDLVRMLPGFDPRNTDAHTMAVLDFVETEVHAVPS